jgi:large repetitive protein
MEHFSKPFIRANKPQRKVSRALLNKRRKAFMERLEDRTLFSALNITAGALTYTGSSSASNLTVSASSGSNCTFTDTDQMITLGSGAISAGWTGSGTNTVTGPESSISSMNITNGSGGQNLTLNYADGNMLPASGLTYDPSAATGGAINALTIEGGSFTSQTQTYSGPGAGTITFNGGTPLVYSNLSPITDTSPAVDYLFSDFGADGSFTATTGPVAGGFQTIQFQSTPFEGAGEFETTDIANKNFVTFDVESTLGMSAVVNIPTPSTGLLSMTYNTSTSGENTQTFTNTPPGIVTSLVGGTDQDVTSVTGLGVADGTVLFLNGDAGVNTLNFDAGGEDPTVTPGLLPGEVLISIPGAGIVDAINYANINITDVAPLTITPGTSPSFSTVEGSSATNAIVGTFTLPLPAIATPPDGMPAGDFTASIGWGDASSSAGSITQDASDPSVYDISGTHTYATNGTYTTTSTVNFIGGSYDATVNGVDVSVALPAAGPTMGITGTAHVAAAPLTGTTGNAISGVEGSSTGTVLLGTFVDGNQSATTANFTSGGGSVVVNWGDGSAPQTLAAGNLTAVGSADGVDWEIKAAHTYTEEGSYAYTITVTESDGAVTTVSGSAVIADGSLTAGSAVVLTPNSGIALANTTVVATFTDANAFATTADFTAQVSWGDGSSPTTGVVVATATPGVFDIEAGHAYAGPGAFTTLVTVTDDGGSQVVVSGTATVTDLPVTGAVKNFAAIEGENTGIIVLATFSDPNLLATAADVSATLPVGGWGDGTPAAVANLTVVQIGGTSSASLFEVLGSHTYAVDGVYTVNVSVKTIGGVVTTLTPGTATVADAPLTPSSSNTITGVEGSSTGSVLLGSLHRRQPRLRPSANYTTPGGSVVVNWGDGSAPQTLCRQQPDQAIGAADGVEWTIKAAHTYTEEGTYAYTVTVTDSGGAATVISGSAIIADAALTAGTTVNLTPNTGAALSNAIVGTFTDANPTAPISDFWATINWGDGSPATTGLVTQPGGVGTAFDVTGSHTYATPGSYTTIISVSDDGGSRVTITGTATVTDLPVTGSVKNFTAVEGENTGAVVLATFSDPNPLATAADVAATIPVGGWGDGTPVSTTGLAIVQIGGSSTASLFEVVGSHTYAESGSFTVHVTITTSGGVVTALTSGTATVADAPLTPSAGNSITGIEGSSTGTVLLGSFVDGNQSATVSDFTTDGGSVVVNWGDGSAPQTLSAGNLASIGSAAGIEWTINAAHTYAEEGTYAYHVTVTDNGGATTIIFGSAIIADAPLTAGAPVSLVSSTGLPISGTIGTFTDANPVAPISDFTATIDWGDGSPDSIGVITQPGGVGTPFDVTGTHSYAIAGTFQTVINVTDDGGSKVTLLGTATIALTAPHKLHFVQHPTSGHAGKTLGATVIDVQSLRNQTIKTDSSSVTLAVAFGPAGGALIGTTTVTAVKGVATFKNLTIDVPGTYILIASDNGAAEESYEIVVKG